MVAERFEPEGIVCKAVHLQHPGEDELRRRLEKRKENLITIERRIVNSGVTEKQALQNPNLYLIEPGSPKQVLNQVIGIIYSP